MAQKKFVFSTKL